jgi:hypothetical protein
MPASLFPVLLAAHITLAIGVFLPSLLLPFALRAQRPATTSQSSLVQSLLWLQSNGTVVIGAGLALTGAAMLTILGPSLLAQPWLLVALAIYVANLALASSSSARAFAGWSVSALPGTTRDGANGRAASGTSATRWPRSSA